MSQANSSVSSVTAKTGKSANVAPVKWWQWILYYPQFPVAVIGLVGGFFGALGGLSPAIIQWLDRPPQETRLGTHETQLNSDNETQFNSDTDTQLNLWKRNADCIRAAGVSHIKLREQSLYDIDISGCSETGDLLLEMRPRDDGVVAVSHWISTKPIYQLALIEKASYSLIGTAQAQEGRRARPTKIIATKIEGNTVVQRQQLSDNTCVEITIDPNTGRHLRSKRSPCVPF